MQISVWLGGRYDGYVAALAKVDPGDFEDLNQHRWFLNNNGYAARTVRRADTGRRSTLLMHRYLLGLDFGDPLQGDHINRVRLDNRRENLRTIDIRHNAQNKAVRRGPSIYRGVILAASGKRWMAKVNNRHLGTFDTEAEAAEVARAERARVMPYATD